MKKLFLLFALLFAPIVAQAQIANFVPYLYNADGKPAQPTFGIVTSPTDPSATIQATVRPYDKGAPRDPNFFVLMNSDGTPYSPTPGYANPTAQVGLSAINGVATTGMRSDAAPALNVAIIPTWTGTHTFSNTVNMNGAVNISSASNSVPQAVQFANTNQIANTAFVQAALGTLKGYINGCTLSTAGASVSFSVVTCQAADSTGTLLMGGGSLTKTLASTWSVGAAGGCLDTGTSTSNTWYTIYIINRPDTGVTDYTCSASTSAPTTGGAIPAAYTKFRRIGAIFSNASTQWAGFKQIGDKFLYTSPPTPVNGVVTGSGALVSYSAVVPSGVQVDVLYQVNAFNGGGAWYGAVFSSDQCGLTLGQQTASVSAPAGAGIAIAAQGVATASTTGTLCYAATTGTTISVNTYGYIDYRGRL